MSSRITIPRLPDESAPHRFPIFATIAPVVASVALWAVTRSVYALAFAALGPVIAVASGLDARLQRRRTAAREAERFARDCEAARLAISRAHDGERLALEERTPAMIAIMTDLARSPSRWRTSADGDLTMRLGRADVASSVELLGDDEVAAVDGSPRDRAIRAIGALRSTASLLVSAAVAVEGTAGIGVVGTPRLVAALVRSLALQCSVAFSPATHVVRAPQNREWSWIDHLPHDRVADHAASSVLFDPAAGSQQDARAVQIWFGEVQEELPRDLAIVVEVAPNAGARLTRVASGAGKTINLMPEFVAWAEAVSAACQLSVLAGEEGALRPSAGLPQEVSLSALLKVDREPDPGLAAILGVAGGGAMEVDLVSDGPHAIVGGTTGSGKSELLMSWILSMAATRSPHEVTFLFVDFKGGASFDPLAELPHCVGVITDLDIDESIRALTSLGAELRYRERTLAALGLRSIDDGEGHPFARLVVVVDEYAALVDHHHELHAVFIDIASRGRSLGVHLVLCTQRPAGIVRDGIMANAGLRISLRVNSASDSAAVIGTDDAATLPARPLGRALVSIAGAAPALVQVARSSREDVAAVSARSATATPPRRPWCPPLADVIPVGQLGARQPSDDFAFCVVDRPELQAQETGVYTPRAHGSLLVVGAAGSGKSSLLDTFEQTPSLIPIARVARTLPAVWDAVCESLEGEAQQAAGSGRLLLIDDIDEILASGKEEYSSALIDLLERVVREAPSRGVHVVLTAQRLPGALQTVGALCGSRLLFRMPDRAEHVLAGGIAATFSSGLSPGAGHWDGQRIQVLAGEQGDRAAASPGRIDTIDGRHPSPLAVVSTQPERVARALSSMGRAVALLQDYAPGQCDPGASRGGQPVTYIGDTEAWHAHWSLYGALRARAHVLFDGCSLVDFRAITRIRELPPPGLRSERPMWLLGPDGALTRCRLVP
jgi:S-DNA-T family DNA segregation ATPase FtsK/SpoIIIE